MGALWSAKKQPRRTGQKRPKKLPGKAALREKGGHEKEQHNREKEPGKEFKKPKKKPQKEKYVDKEAIMHC